MHDNRSHPPFSLPFAPPSHFLCHGIINATPLPLWKDLGHPDHVMFLFHASSILSLILFSLHLSSFLLTKLFKFTFRDEIFERDALLEIPHVDEYREKEDLVADIVEGETLVFLHRESAFNDNLAGEQGKDSEEAVTSEGSDTFVPESTYDSPPEDFSHDKHGIEYDDDVSTTTNVPTILDSEDFTLGVDTCDEDKVTPNEEEQQEFSGDDEENLIIVTDIKSPDVEKLHVEQVHEEKDHTFAGSLNGESTSKSSVEWRSSTIFRDSETDYSSSRRSSSRWESYTLFRKYDEEMLFFDRITAQKLSETESLRSIKVHPRSISERIVHKLSTKPVIYATGGRKDPYQELESAYVAQICLTWEALNWNYTNFSRKKSSECNYGCPARIAQQFQQFQVLLQRFIENEPYEYGRRPEVYARRRISSPMLLQVPEFRDSEGDEGKEDTSSNISSDEFVVILEYAIRTFMNFLKADKEKCCDKVRAFIKRKSSSADPIFHRFLKKANKKKKLRLKDIGRRQRCITNKRRLKQEEEMEILMGLIDLKVASRVLRMAEVSSQQLHWCEEKMRKVRVWDGKMQRDSTPLFFPVH